MSKGLKTISILLIMTVALTLAGIFATPKVFVAIGLLTVLELLVLFLSVYLLPKVPYVRRQVEKVLNAPKVKGLLGDKAVSEELKKLNKNEYTHYNNLQLPTINGEITMIDHLIVSKQGVFVIVQKNYNGTIYGKEKEQDWLQVLGKKKYPIPNPINPSKGAVKVVREIVGSKVPVHLILCFTDSSTLEVRYHTARVICTSELTDTIKNFECNKLTDKTLQTVNECLRGKRLKKNI